jgi:hypothetical protein
MGHVLGAPQLGAPRQVVCLRRGVRVVFSAMENKFVRSRVFFDPGVFLKWGLALSGGLS